MNKDIENLKTMVADLEDAEDGAFINLHQGEIKSLKAILKLLDDIEIIDIPIDTLIAEFERLENIEDDRDCNYIHKDKIKEKIEELEKINESHETHKVVYSAIDIIKMLKELLEE